MTRPDPDEHPSSTYVEGGAVLTGFGAYVLSAVAARHLPRYLAGLTPEQRREVEVARRVLSRAGDAYARHPVSLERRGETGPSEIPGPSGRDDLVSTHEAARLLGVSVRRAQQLAAQGLGERMAGRWWLDRCAVTARAAGPRSDRAS